jgi:predicted ABC-type ATPase
MTYLYIIAGCNGAGKTTASYTILPEMLNCREFVNADEIAKGISPFQPEKAAIDAGKIMLARINELISSRIDFSFETTLAPKYFVNLINLYIPVCDYWILINNSENPFKIVAEGLKNTELDIKDNLAWDKINRQYHE